MIGAIIQARMASTRLPGKVLLEVNGRPLLDYLLERLKASKKIEKIIIATTANSKDDVIASYAKKNNIPFFRGSEEDVLDRYYRAAKKFNIDHVIRITADCPLIDPKLCDEVIDTYLKEKADYACLGPTFAEGLGCEIFSFEVLENVHENALKKSEREHVTLFINTHQDQFRRIVLRNSTDDGSYRYTLDHPEDFEVIKAIILALYRGPIPFESQQTRQFLDHNKVIFAMNAHIKRNEGLLISLKKHGELQG